MQVISEARVRGYGQEVVESHGDAYSSLGSYIGEEVRVGLALGVSMSGEMCHESVEIYLRCGRCSVPVA